MRISFFLFFFLSSCISAEIDRSFQNHPLMRVDTKIIQVKPKLTNLGSIEASSGGGKCVTCAN